VDKIGGAFIIKKDAGPAAKDRGERKDNAFFRYPAQEMRGITT